jgi:hypothetical protein
MRDIYQYFDWFHRHVEDCGAESAEFDFTARSSVRGSIRGAIYYYDGSRLEITERVHIESRRPVKRRYVYQYVSGAEAVFRYDNAPHHPDLPNYPHHKHVGRQRIAALEPSLKQVLEEVAGLLKEATPTKVKRRRPSKRAGTK